MSTLNNDINGLPDNFQDERNALKAAGISRWSTIKNLKDKDLNSLARNGRSTIHNLKKIRGIAQIICEMGLSPQDASLLIYSGIPSINALARITPQQLVLQTGRVKRQLSLNNEPLLGLGKAHYWIQKAKRQTKN